MGFLRSHVVNCPQCQQLPSPGTWLLPPATASFYKPECTNRPLDSRTKVIICIRLNLHLHTELTVLRFKEVNQLCQTIATVLEPRIMCTSYKILKRWKSVHSTVSQHRSTWGVEGGRSWRSISTHSRGRRICKIYTHTRDKQSMLCSPGIITGISMSSSLSNTSQEKQAQKPLKAPVYMYTLPRGAGENVGRHSDTGFRPPSVSSSLSLATSGSHHLSILTKV